MTFRLSAHLRQVGDPKHEADRVQNVGLAATIKPRDSVKVSIKVWNVDPGGVGLKALDSNLFNIHIKVLS